MDDCIFCKIAAGEVPSYKVYETAHAYVFLDIHPVNDYHTLVIPKQHYVNIFDVPEEVLLNVMSALKHVVDLYKEKLGLDQAQIISCAGPEGQQEVFHLHFHIVPRHTGDGQDVVWHPHPERVDRFPELLERLR